MSEENTTVTTTTPAAPKTFSEEYVKELREENKTFRQNKKAAEDKIRKLVGLKDDEDIDDSKITAWQTAQQKAITDKANLANERLIKAEIKSLDGYDSKLVERLLDKSKVTIADDGTVKGITEQLADLEKEFPVIKKAVAANPANPAPGAVLDEYAAAMAAWRKNPNDSNLRNRAFELKEKHKE